MHPDARCAAASLGGEGGSAPRSASSDSAAVQQGWCPPGDSFSCAASGATCHVCPAAQVKLCLVVNKIDRLILELCLTPLEAYERLKAIIAHVNMIVSSFHSEKYISGGAGGRGPHST